MKNEMPVFIYSMVPFQTTSYKNFFEAGPLKSLLENPGQLRSAGWDLTTNSHAKIIKGDYIELTSAERKRIQVYEDGSVFVRVSADNDYLSWGLNDNQFPRNASFEHLGSHRILSQLLQTMFGLNEAYGAPAARGRIEGRDSKRILRQVETVSDPASGIDLLVFVYG
jgi:hypothetical protein